MKRIIFVIAILAVAVNASAETLRLRSGKILEGTVVAQTDSYVKVDTGEIISKVVQIEKPVVKKDQEKESEYTFQEIPINEGVTIPSYNYRWDVTDITFNTDDIPVEIQGRNGEQKIYYPEGNLKASCEYKNGILDGICRTFSRDGTPVMVARYKDGQFDSLLKVYYANGSLYYDSMPDGKAVEYYDNGQVKLERTNEYAKTFWRDGKLRREVKYATLSDKRIRGQYFDYDVQSNVLMRHSRITHSYDDYMKAGREQEKKGDWAKALMNYQQAYHIDPTATGVNMAIGTIYFKTGSITSAIDFFEKTTRMAPNHITARIAAGVASRMMKQYDKALIFFKEAQKLDPNSTLPLIEIGRTYYTWGRPTEARTYFERALDIEPDSIAAFEGLKMTELQE